MKEIAIFGSYSDTERKQKLLENSLDKAKKMGIDTLVYAHYALPKHIQDKCTYYIFDVSNPVFKNEYLHVWNILYFKRQIFVKQNEYGYAAIQQIPRALGFANTLDYDIAYWFVYDVDISELSKWRDTFKQRINEGNEILYNDFYRIQNSEPEGIAGIYSVFKVKNVWEKIKGGINKRHYRHMVKNNRQFIAETYLKYLYNLVDLKLWNLNQEESIPYFPPLMDATGDRTLGQIPSDLFPKIHNHLERCFVGKSENDGKPYIQFWDIKHHIDTITVNFGTYTRTFKYEESTIQDEPQMLEFEIDSNITQIEIVEINGESINELIDVSISPSIFDIHIIRNECVAL
jgi:hypothetical protein